MIGIQRLSSRLAGSHRNATVRAGDTAPWQRQAEVPPYARRGSRLIEDFESAASFTRVSGSGTASDISAAIEAPANGHYDLSQFRTGTQAVLFNPGDGATTYWRKALPSIPFDPAGNWRLTLNVKLVNPDAGNMGIWLRFYNDAGYTARVHTSQTYTSSSDNWRQLVLTKTSGWTFAGGGTFSSPMVGLEIVCVAAAGQAEGVILDNLMLSYDDAPCVVMEFDDGASGVYTVAYPILRQYGVRASAHIITDAVRATGKMQWHQIRELAAAGWDISPHADTTDHHTTWAGRTQANLSATYDLAAQLAIIQTAQSDLQAQGIAGAGLNVFCVPGSAWDNSTLAAMATAGITICEVSGSMPAIGALPIPNAKLGCYHANLGSGQTGGGWASVKSTIDSKLGAGLPLWLIGHDVVPSSTTPGAQDVRAGHLQAVVAYIRAAYPHVPWLTLSEFAALQSGVSVRA